MKDLDWDDYYNEFSRVRGAEAKTNKAIYRLLPAEYGFNLRVLDAYTGEHVKDFPCMDQQQAISIAQNLNYKIHIGHSLRDLIK